MNEPTRETPDLIEILLAREKIVQTRTTLIKFRQREGFALILLSRDQFEVQADRHATVLTNKSIVVTQMLY